MKHYLLFEEAGNEFVIECKDYDDAIKQAGILKKTINI